MSGGAAARRHRGAMLRRTVLPNGLVAIARRNPASRSITVRMTFEAGAACDPPGKEGLATLTAALLDRGAGELTGAAIAQRFDGLGATCLAGSGRDTLDIEARLLASHLPRVLDLLSVIVRRPSFPEAEIERERAQMRTAIAERDQDTRQVAEMTLAALLYPEGHPYHAPALGTAASVARIARADLVAFHDRRFRPGGAIMALAGDLDPARAFEEVAARFGSWRGTGDPAPGTEASRAIVPDPPPLGGPVIRVTPIPGKSQVDIALGFPGIRRASPELPAAMLLSHALGEFSLGGRLAAAVRERAGLAYYASSRVSAGLGAGSIVARAGVARDRARRAVDLIRSTIARVVARGFTPQELRDSRRAITASLPRRLETNPEATRFLCDCEFYGMGTDYLERLAQRMNAVRASEVHAFARRHLTLERCALVVAGSDLKEEDLR